MNIRRLRCSAQAHDKREDSLRFSARINVRIIETTEVDLETLKVVQLREVCNKNTECHDRIVRLINANTHLIKERITA